MFPDLHYEECSPPPDLAAVLQCVWQLTGPPPRTRSLALEPIVPDGCPEIVLNVGDPFLHLDGSASRVRQPRSMLVGQLTRPAFVGPSGGTRIVGIRFLPWGASRFLGIPLGEIRDSFLALDSVVTGGMEDLLDQLATGPLEEWAETVFNRLRSTGRCGGVPPGLAARAVRDIRERRGRVSVKALARRLFVSERQLERVMQRDVGLPPVVLARIIRVQVALGQMIDVTDRSLAEVAVRSGFFDQSHFVREFRRLVGCTPSEFRRAAPGLTDHFISTGSDDPQLPQHLSCFS